MLTQIFPTQATIEDTPTEINNEARPKPAERPWLYVNMITTADGAISHQGSSAILGGPADHEVFRSLRSTADVIMAGANTVRTELYRPPPTAEAIQELRLSLGLSARPKIAIVSQSVDLDPQHPVFSDPQLPPFIITGSANRQNPKLAALKDRAEIILSGQGQSADLKKALQMLNERGICKVLSEGGPTLNAQLIADDLVDEWNLTVAPLLSAGSAKRAALGPTAANPPHQMELKRVWMADEYLFCRWTRPVKL